MSEGHSQLKIEYLETQWQVSCQKLQLGALKETLTFVDIWSLPQHCLVGVQVSALSWSKILVTYVRRTVKVRAWHHYRNKHKYRQTGVQSQSLPNAQKQFEMRVPLITSYKVN